VEEALELAEELLRENEYVQLLEDERRHHGG